VGPSGYGKARLGMSFREVEESGALEEGAEPPEGECDTYRLAEGDHSVRHFAISSSSAGLAVIAASGARTPEGKGAGSTLEELKQEYPNGSRSGERFKAPTGEGGEYWFTLDGDKASALFLVAGDLGGC
jgi:hypothetical protein